MQLTVNAGWVSSHQAALMCDRLKEEDVYNFSRNSPFLLLSESGAFGDNHPRERSWPSVHLLEVVEPPFLLTVILWCCEASIELGLEFMLFFFLLLFLQVSLFLITSDRYCISSEALTCSSQTSILSCWIEINAYVLKKKPNKQVMFAVWLTA